MFQGLKDHQTLKTSFRWKLQIVLSGGPINSFLPCSIKEQGYFYYSHFWENDKNLITLNTVFFIKKEKKGQHDDAYMYYATFEAQFMKNLNNTEAELKNSVFF